MNHSINRAIPIQNTTCPTMFVAGSAAAGQGTNQIIEPTIIITTAKTKTSCFAIANLLFSHHTFLTN